MLHVACQQDVIERLEYEKDQCSSAHSVTIYSDLSWNAFVHGHQLNTNSLFAHAQFSVPEKVGVLFLNLFLPWLDECTVLDMYLERLPPEAKENVIFYCRPLQCFKDKTFWYSAQPRGIYTS